MAKRKSSDLHLSITFPKRPKSYHMTELQKFINDDYCDVIHANPQEPQIIIAQAIILAILQRLPSKWHPTTRKKMDMLLHEHILKVLNAFNGHSPVNVTSMQEDEFDIAANIIRLRYRDTQLNQDNVVQSVFRDIVTCAIELIRLPNEQDSDMDD